MPILDGFIGGSYLDSSPNADSERSINLFVENIESGKGVSPAVLLGTPGLALFGTLPRSPVRALFSGGAPLNATPAPRCFAVAGDHVYEVFSDGSSADRGYVGNDGNPAQLFPNGNQLLIVSAGAAYLDNGGAASGSNAQPVVFSASTVNTLDTPVVGTVIWISGSHFDPEIHAPGEYVVINGMLAIVATYIDANHLTLTYSIGTASNVPIAYGVVRINSGSTAVTRVAGPPFDTTGATGLPVVIGGVSYTVASYDTPDKLTLTSGAVTSNPGASFQPQISAAYGAFIDGYYVALQASSRRFQISAINDGTVWNPIDFGVKEGNPDYIGAIFADHEELWLMGSETIEVWDNTGAVNFPFVRNPSGYIHQGIAAPYSVVHLAGSVAWLGGDSRGLPVAFRSKGFIPVRVSTHAIEAIWGGYSTLKDATAYVYEDGGHDFWVINFPTANATWVYDNTASLWHERAWWNGASLDRHRSNCHAFCFGKHLVGDWQNGKVYQMSTALYDDAGVSIHGIRIAAHSTNEDNFVFYERFRLDADNTGALNPTLSWSNDGGRNFINASTTTSNTAGALAQFEWRRLGKARDRVFQILITASVKRALVQAWLNSSSAAL